MSSSRKPARKRAKRPPPFAPRAALPPALVMLQFSRGIAQRRARSK